MSRYGTYESEQYVEVIKGDDGVEVGFLLTISCCSLGCRAQISGPPEGCYPAESAEFELDSVHLIGQDGNHYPITEEIFATFVGPEIEEIMVEAAKLDADENGDFS